MPLPASPRRENLLLLCLLEETQPGQQGQTATGRGGCATPRPRVVGPFPVTTRNTNSNRVVLDSLTSSF